MFSMDVEQRTFQDYLLVWIEAFLKDRKAQNASAGTMSFYRQKLKWFADYCQGIDVKTISQITPNLIRDYLLHLEETHHNSGGVHAAYRALRTFLRWYWAEQEPGGKNPINRVKAPRLVQEPIQGVTLEQFEALLKACVNERDKALLMVLMDTGVRAQELLDIQVEDIDFSSVLIRQGKGRKPRTVFIGRRTRRQLHRYFKEWQPQTYLFTNDEGDKMTYPALRQILRRLALRADVPYASPHNFRRGYAIEALRRGVDLLTLSRLLGHSSLNLLPRYAKQTSLDLAGRYRSIVDEG